MLEYGKKKKKYLHLEAEYSEIFFFTYIFV